MKKLLRKLVWFTGKYHETSGIIMVISLIIAALGLILHMFVLSIMFFSVSIFIGVYLYLDWQVSEYTQKRKLN